MENTTKEKIKEIRRKLKEGEITIDEACDLLEELCGDGGASTQGDGPPVGGGGGSGPGGGNP